MRMEKQDKEIMIIMILSVIGLIFSILFVNLYVKEEEEYTPPVIREIEYHTSLTYVPRVSEPSVSKEETVEKVIEEVPEEVTEEGFMGYTLEEIEMVAQMVMDEGEGESFDVKQGLAEVAFNREKSNYKEFRFQNTIEEVLNTPHQWCSVHRRKPTKECYEAVYAALEFNAFPDDMLWARANRVDYGYEYTIDSDSVTKFSTVNNYQGEE